jgi:GR25 family glycosyltransferase involved in LPS biosynthesis
MSNKTKDDCVRKSIKVKNPKIYLKKSIKKCTRSGKCYNNFNQKMGVYVINCSIHKDRLKKFKKFASKAGVKACRVPCVKGKQFTDEILCDMVKRGFLKKSADMDRIEISINLSHYNCWIRLINSCLDYALILEDDVELNVDFVEKINLILDELEDNDIDFSVLHLFNGNWNKTKSKLKKVLTIDSKLQILKETVSYNAGAAGYIISKKYAEFLISKFFPISMPNDMLVGNYPKKGNHLTLFNKFNKKKDCYESPLFKMPCGGPEGTGASTRVNISKTIKEKSCKSC